jgi:hypothetical protein
MWKEILNLRAEVERLQRGKEQQSAGCAGSLTN